MINIFKFVLFFKYFVVYGVLCHLSLILIENNVTAPSIHDNSYQIMFTGFIQVFNTVFFSLL